MSKSIILERLRGEIEKHAKTMEELGLSPVPARVYVYLMFGSPPGTTFEELVTYFSISKSAVSNALKMLQTVGMVDSRTLGGKRRRYFYVEFGKTFSQRYLTSKFTMMMDLVDDVRKLRGKDDLFGKQLEHAALFYRMLLVEMPIVLERWKRTIEMDQR